MPAHAFSSASPSLIILESFCLLFVQLTEFFKALAEREIQIETWKLHHIFFTSTAARHSVDFSKYFKGLWAPEMGGFLFCFLWEHGAEKTLTSNISCHSEPKAL